VTDGVVARPAILPKAAGKTSLGLKLIYGLGSASFGIKDNGFSSFLLFFYNQVVGLGPVLSGLAIGIALFADAFIDPIIGEWSDNLRTRWGRRHPLMYASAFPVAISYLLLWSPPHLGQTGLFIYLTAVAILVRSFISLYEVPSAALAPELTTDYNERTALLGFRMFFAFFGGLGMVFLAYAVFLRPDAAHPVGQLNPVGYARYGMTAAIIMAAAILVSAAGTHHRIKTLSVPPDRGKRSIGMAIREVIEAASNRSFLTILCSSLFSSAAIGLVFSLAIYFNTYLWELKTTQLAVLAPIDLFAVAVSVALAPVMSRWLGKRNGTMVFFVIGMAIGTIPMALRLCGWFVPNGDPLLFPIIAVTHVLSLSLSVGAAILATSMIADVVEDSQVKTGRRSEGLFFAANSFIQKAVTGIGLFLSAMLLKAAHFPDKGAVQADAIRLALFYIPVVLGLFAVSTTILFGYRITRASHEQNLLTLAEAAASETLTPDL
jgi:Na+/melibiose symporter-like transporter